MSRFDGNITVFSSDGELLQVHYAHEASRRGPVAVGVRGADAVVLAVEKRMVLKLQEERTERKVMALDNHVMMACTGLRADARVLFSRAQIECQSHRLVLGSAATLAYIARYIAELKQKYTQSNGRRPFGTSCLIGGFDPDGTPRLFLTEPSGDYYEWMASSTGRCDKTTREFLEKQYTPETVSTEGGAVRLAVRALFEVMQSGQRNIEVAVLKRGERMKLLKKEEINTIASEVEKEKEDRVKKRCVKPPLDTIKPGSRTFDSN